MMFSIFCLSCMSHQNEARRSRLFCRYQDGNMNPRLLLKPMKEEDEWDSPHIVRYLEMLSHEEIEKIKELAKPRVRQECNVEFKGVFFVCFLFLQLFG